MLTHMAKQLPSLVVVVGATACGKSKLAIELATRFGAEIISADSMQVYKGLDIATNKVTRNEMAGVTHHLMSFLEPTQHFSVIDFRNKSLAVIEKLHENNTLPIVVGGTNYYIESLLWKQFTMGSPDLSLKRLADGTFKNESIHDPHTLFDSEERFCQELPPHSDQDIEDIDKFFSKPIFHSSFGDIQSEKLWHILEKVDPDSAHKYHYNNRRGIIRALQIYQDTGKTYSDQLKDRNVSTDDSKKSLGGPLRFNRSCVIWLHCEEELLNKIVDDRVDKMIEMGLLKELEEFHKSFNEQRILQKPKPNYVRGVYQTIGFKEFHDYLILAQEERDSDAGNKVLKRCIDEMKQSTKRYVKKQLKWIRSRLMRTGIRDLPHLFKLSTEVNEEAWIEKVRNPAIEIVECLIGDRPWPEKLVELQPELETDFESYSGGKFFCDVCDRSFIGNKHINDHLKSKRHQKRKDSLKCTCKEPIESAQVAV